jgi:hypothetical protein
MSQDLFYFPLLFAIHNVRDDLLWLFTRPPPVWFKQRDMEDIMNRFVPHGQLKLVCLLPDPSFHFERSKSAMTKLLAGLGSLDVLRRE